MKKVLMLAVFTLIIASLLVSCTKKDEGLRYIEFYYYKNDSQMNIISTKDNYIQKYIDVSGTKKVDYQASQSELQEIHEAIKQSKLDEIEGEIKSSLSKDDSSVTKYVLKFRLNGKKYELKGDYTAFDHVNESDETKRFCNFIQFIMEFMRSTDEFNSI